jgi:transcriptional regulator with XRE-family HTH domain
MGILKKFGQRLRYLRLKQGLSQEELAERADLHRTYISSVELGKRNVSLKNIEALAHALDVPISMFFGDEQGKD